MTILTGWPMQLAFIALGTASVVARAACAWRDRQARVRCTDCQQQVAPDQAVYMYRGMSFCRSCWGE